MYIQGDSDPHVQETPNVEDERKRFANDTSNKSSYSSVSSDKFDKVADNFEPIDVEGQNETGIWVHHPGSEVSQTWESRKGKSRRLDNEIQNDTGGHSSVTSGCLNNEDSGTDKNLEEKRRMKSVRKGLNRICSVFHKNPRKENSPSSTRESVLSGRANLREISENDIGVRFIVEDGLSGSFDGNGLKEGVVTSGGSGSEGKGKVKNKSKKPAEKSSREIRKSQSDSYAVREREILEDLDSSDEDAEPKQLK